MPEENTYEMPADNLKIEEAYVNDNPDLEELGFEQEASSPKEKKESDRCGTDNIEHFVTGRNAVSNYYFT